MKLTFAPLRRVDTWRKYWRYSEGSCGLANCSGSKSLWGRVWQRRNGVHFDGVLYCHPQCLETAVRQELTRLQAYTPSSPPANRMPLGLLMVARGKLSYDQVLVALAAQRKSGGSIGEWFEKLGFLTEQEVAAALGLQWGCPVASSLEFHATSHNLPIAILETFLMWPVQHVSATNTLHIAFGKRVDHVTLYAIEKMLGCHTQPCVAAPRIIASRIERLRQEPRLGEIEFRSMRDTAEMVRIATGYIGRLAAEEIRISRLGSLIWLLMKNRLTSLHLLFRLRTDAQLPQVIEHLHSTGSVENEAHPWQKEVFSAFSASRR
jgi:hypothetical protein